jgi:hypothetical protein
LGLKDYTEKKNKMKIGMRSMTAKSVKSVNHFKSVILTSYNIVKAHGGELIVISAIGEVGTEFTINIPFKSIL